MNPIQRTETWHHGTTERLERQKPPVLRRSKDKSSLALRSPGSHENPIRHHESGGDEVGRHHRFCGSYAPMK